MQRLTVVFIGVFLMLIAGNAIAGGNHYHGPIGDKQAGYTAESVVRNLVSQKELEQSWAQSSIKSIKKTKLKGDIVWRAMFTNDQITTPGKKNLNVFLTLTGGFIKAGYSDGSLK